MTFSFSSAINNLVSGAAENVADVVTCFNDVKTQFNSDTETAFSTYKQILPSVGLQNGDGSSVGTLTSGNTYLLAEGFTGSATTQLPASFRAGASVFYIDPADYTANARTNKYRLRVSLLTNATAPTSTFTVGLYPVSAVAGGSALNTVTLGAVTAGSTVAFAAPASSTPSQGNSGDFTAPVAGFYAIGCAITVASSVANATVAVRAIIQQRQV